MLHSSLPPLDVTCKKKPARGPALIVRPLRYIIAQNSFVERDSTGTPVLRLGATAREAKRWAAQGRGDMVQRIARSLPA
jgi:hypothetical protein